MNNVIKYSTGLQSRRRLLDLGLLQPPGNHQDHNLDEDNELMTLSTTTTTIMTTTTRRAI